VSVTRGAGAPGELERTLAKDRMGSREAAQQSEVAGYAQLESERALSEQRACEAG
jgi:uncharacterized protein YaiL (DUF2058 family)